MSEIQLTAFLNKVLGFFVEFLALMFMYMVVLQFTVFYFMKGEVIFYYASIGVLGVAICFSVNIVKDFQHFHDIYEENISNSKLNVELNKPLNVEVKERALKACLLYRNGDSFKQITQKLRLGNESNTSIRLVRKGLDILLKEHNIKEVKRQ